MGDLALKNFNERGHIKKQIHIHELKESVRNWWFSQCRHYFLVKFNCLMPANGNGSLCINP